MIPHWTAIAAAVRLKSPVTMRAKYAISMNLDDHRQSDWPIKKRIPARLQILTVSFVSSRGGSTRATSPTTTKSILLAIKNSWSKVGLSKVSLSKDPIEITFLARRRTRWPWLAKEVWRAVIDSMAVSSRLEYVPSGRRYWAQRLRRISGAPAGECEIVSELY